MLGWHPAERRSAFHRLPAPVWVDDQRRPKVDPMDLSLERRPRVPSEPSGSLHDLRVVPGVFSLHGSYWEASCTLDETSTLPGLSKVVHSPKMVRFEVDFIQEWPLVVFHQGHSSLPTEIGSVRAAGRSEDCRNPLHVCTWMSPTTSGEATRKPRGSHEEATTRRGEVPNLLFSQTTDSQPFTHRLSWFADG